MLPAEKMIYGLLPYRRAPSATDSQDSIPPQTLLFLFDTYQHPTMKIRARLALHGLVAALAGAVVTFPRLPAPHALGQPPLHPRRAPPSATFTQYIEHDDPTMGTFEQRYWWDVSAWGGPGWPVRKKKKKKKPGVE
jgi:hypothetical protein